MASILAASREQSIIELCTQEIRKRTPHVHFAKFAEPAMVSEFVYAACTKCGSPEEYDLQVLNSFGRSGLDRLIGFMRDYEKNHQHLPVAEPPEVRTERVEVPSGRKFRE